MKPFLTKKVGELNLRFASTFEALVDHFSCMQLGETPSGLQKSAVADGRVAEAIGGHSGGSGGGNDDDDLQARLDSLRR